MKLYERIKLAASILAGRPRNIPERETYENPFLRILGLGVGAVNRPMPKPTPRRLRTFSESPIPRRALNIIKEGVAQLQWDIVAKDQAKAEALKEQIKIAKAIFARPNNSDTFRLLIEQIIEDVLVGACGSIEKQRSGDLQKPMYLYPVDGFSIQLYQNWDGDPKKPRYAQVVGAEQIDLLDNELIYIRTNPRSSTPFGLAPLESAYETINFLLDAGRYAGRTASKAWSKKLLDLGKEIPDNGVTAFREYFKNEVEGRGIMPIIGGGDGAKSIDLGPQDDKGLYLEWQHFLITVIGLCMGVSPAKLGELKQVNYSTAESEDEDTKSTIRGYADLLAEHFNFEILEPLGFSELEFKFIYNISLKDQKLQADTHSIYLEKNVLTIDEIRAELGKTPLPDGKGKLTLDEFRAKYGIKNDRFIDVGKLDTTTKVDPLKIDPNIDPNLKKNKSKQKQLKEGDNLAGDN